MARRNVGVTTKWGQLGDGTRNPELEPVVVVGLTGDAPTVAGVTPAVGPMAGGTAVTITGTGFDGGATVTIGGVAATGVTVVNATSITATTGAHAAGAVDVAVTNPDTQTGTLANGFTYQAPAPTVTNVTPALGSTAGGTAVTITGTGFVAGATVTIGGVATTGVTVVSATSITATTGAHGAGAVDVVVTNPDTQTGMLTGGFTYEAAPPVTYTRYFAEGATAGSSTRRSHWRTRAPPRRPLSPSACRENGTDFTTPGPAAPQSVDGQHEARSRPHAAGEFSTVIESDIPVVVDRTIMGI